MSKPGHEGADSLIEAGKIGQLAKNVKICQVMFPDCDQDMNELRKGFETGFEIAQKI